MKITIKMKKHSMLGFGSGYCLTAYDDDYNVRCEQLYMCGYSKKEARKKFNELLKEKNLINKKAYKFIDETTTHTHSWLLN